MLVVHVSLQKSIVVTLCNDSTSCFHAWCLFHALTLEASLVISLLLHECATPVPESHMPNPGARISIIAKNC